jgi:hypothetical protein
MARDDGREHGVYNGRATLDEVIVVATSAVVLVSVTSIGVAVALRAAGAGAVRMLDVLGE